MPRLVDLRKKPYCLDEEQIAWVENTLAHLTDEEKSVNCLSIYSSSEEMLLAEII